MARWERERGLPVYRVQTQESPAPNIAAAIYEVSAAFAVRGARLSDSYWEWHRRLEAEGRLDHRGEDCPARRGLEVQRWIPAAGWQAQIVPVQ